MDDYLRLMRLDRPVGTLLLLWPTLAALVMAASGFPPGADHHFYRGHLCYAERWMCDQ